MLQPTIAITTVRDGDRRALWAQLLSEIEAAVGAAIAARAEQLTDAGLYLAAHELRLELSGVVVDAAEG